MVFVRFDVSLRIPTERPAIRVPQVIRSSGNMPALSQSGLRPKVSCHPGIAAWEGKRRSQGVGTARMSVASSPSD